MLSEQEVVGLLSIEEVLEVVELAFRESALGYAQMPPKVYLKYLKHNGDLRTMPSYLERLDVSSVKIVTVHPDNMKKFGLPTVMATILLTKKWATSSHNWRKKYNSDENRCRRRHSRKVPCKERPKNRQFHRSRGSGKNPAVSVTLSLLELTGDQSVGHIIYC